MARKARRVLFWDLGSGLALETVREFASATFGPAVRCSAPKPLLEPRNMPSLARRLVKLRVPDPGRQAVSGSRHSRKDREALERVLRGGAPHEERRACRLSGMGLQGALASVLGPSVYSGDGLNLVFTQALPLTWDSGDCRYHARSVVCGYPSVISLSGAVEGPGRPRGYYVARMMGLSEEEARRKYIGRFLEHDDVRLPEVAKGLASQALFYHLTGEPFCEKEGCRLFNAHWQEQLVEAQVRSGRFCEAHGRVLKELRRARDPR